MQQVTSHLELFEQITHWRKKGNTHQGPTGEDGHDVNQADGGVLHTNNGAQGAIQTGKPEFIANKLEVVHGSELERSAWGGTSIRVPQYNLDIGIGQVMN